MPMTSVASGMFQFVAAGIQSYTVQIVNICFVTLSDAPGDWVLIDAGMPQSAEKIIGASEELNGEGAKPKAIILTHGHFDHVGAIIDLLDQWKVPVYAHTVEMPYLTGEKNYIQPDASVEGGMVAKMSPLFPNEGIDISAYLHPLPEDGTIPHMQGWKWIHTPGHTPGHVSLFRESDHALIAGDAFVTVKQESLYKVLTQEFEISGPPRYLTPDWASSKRSVEKLLALQPAYAVTGHGMPISGELLTSSLTKLVNEFDTIAVPDYGRYVDGIH
ncbi:MBL fold metallo-hydrolase [Bacillus sp. S/N-304-OC-R1]|uniref:MBL fold metallo-hydrolase n=1 Tax=Bacillus sp. S/N-304-OC-R1 TaxID=2758034 RepID=UPI001C8E3090|nr:MBL fold metallo-hydrolase [Bacillus sp. S/N-304-OC-R1]MBY0122067.1 MBL fold metallo-hydrolase [Bacillus sp. S/N-304-OC-R1]